VAVTSYRVRGKESQRGRNCPHVARGLNNHTDIKMGHQWGKVFAPWPQNGDGKKDGEEEEGGLQMSKTRTARDCRVRVWDGVHQEKRKKFKENLAPGSTDQKRCSKYDWGPRRT